MTAQLERSQPTTSPAYISEETPSARSSFLWRLFKHPLLLISIVIHGALLATPIPPATKVEQLTIKEIPVTKTVSLKRSKAKPSVKPTPRPRPRPKPEITQPLPSQRPQPSPQVIPQPATPPNAETPKPKPQDNRSQADKSPTPSAPNAGNNAETDAKTPDSSNQESKGVEPVPIENEAVETIFGELDQALINAELESEFEYIPSPSEFPQPEKFFTPESIKSFDIVSNPTLVASGGIINSPRYYRLTDPAAILASLPTISLFQGASEPKHIGDYGGGPVYELKVEDKNYFINLVKAKSISKATFVVFWRWDPNNPPRQMSDHS